MAAPPREQLVGTRRTIPLPRRQSGHGEALWRKGLTRFTALTLHTGDRSTTCLAFRPPHGLRTRGHGAMALPMAY